MIIEEFAKNLKNDIDEFIKTREQQAEKELIFSGRLTPDGGNMPNLSYFSGKCYESYINPEIEEFAKNLKNDIDEFIKTRELGYGLIRNECVFDVFNVSAGKTNYII